MTELEKLAEDYRVNECGADKTELYLEKAFIAGYKAAKNKSEQLEVLYKWVKAGEYIPDESDSYLVELIDGSIHRKLWSQQDWNRSFSIWEKEQVVKWLKPVQSEIELLKNKILSDVMYIDSILQTNRELGERIAELESALNEANEDRVRLIGDITNSDIYKELLEKYNRLITPDKQAPPPPEGGNWY